MATAAAAVSTHVHDAEAQFLEARKVRTDNARLHTERHRRTDDLQDFWAAFKGFRSFWVRKLQQIQREELCISSDEQASTSIEGNVDEVVVSESEKRRVRLELCLLQDELELRRKQCFSHAPTAAIQQPSSSSSSSSSSSFPAFTLPSHELPLSDLRLLHAEFTQCRDELDRKRNMLLPQGKFVFQRYREAIRLRDQQQQEEEASVANGMATDADNSTINDSSPTAELSESSSASASLAATAHSDSKHTLENVADCEVRVYTDGRVHISGKKKNREGKSQDDSTSMDRIIQLEALDSSPLVLSNIQNSNVVIHDGSCSALHLFQVSHSIITVEQPVRSVHVTACHHVQLYLQSQQLRLHESHDLDCHVKILAGAILEDCTRVTFYTTHTNTATTATTSATDKHDGNHTGSTLDVRDFNWLRSGVPSPNYSIQQESESDGASFRMQSLKEEVPIMEKRNDAASPSIVSETQLAVQNAKKDENNDDDDDDDEL